MKKLVFLLLILSLSVEVSLSSKSLPVDDEVLELLLNKSVVVKLIDSSIVKGELAKISRDDIFIVTPSGEVAKFNKDEIVSIKKLIVPKTDKLRNLLEEYEATERQLTLEENAKKNELLNLFHDKEKEALNYKRIRNLIGTPAMILAIVGFATVVSVSAIDASEKTTGTTPFYISGLAAGALSIPLFIWAADYHSKYRSSFEEAQEYKRKAEEFSVNFTPVYNAKSKYFVLTFSVTF